MAKAFNIKKLCAWMSPQRDPFPNLPIYSGLPNPRVVGNRVIVSSFGGCSVAAFSKIDGKVLWSHVLGDHGGQPVVISKDHVFAVTVRDVVCLDVSTGKLLWTYSPYADDGEEYIYSSPLVIGDRLAYGDSTGSVHCLRVTNGQPVWVTAVASGEWIVAPPIYANNKIYVVTNKSTLTALDPLNGRILWSTPLSTKTIQPPKIINGDVLIVGSKALLTITGTGQLLRQIEFEKVSYTLVFNGLVYCVCILKDAETRAAMHLVEIDGADMRWKVRLSHEPKGLSVDQSGLYLVIPSVESLEFVGLSSRNIEYTVSGMFSGLPDSDENRLYISELQHDIVALELPYRM